MSLISIITPKTLPILHYGDKTWYIENKPVTKIDVSNVFIRVTDIYADVLQARSI